MKIKFRYKDKYTRGEWRYQECDVSSVKMCIELYGLDEIEYEILEVEKDE